MFIEIFNHLIDTYETVSDWELNDDDQASAIQQWACLQAGITDEDLMDL